MLINVEKKETHLKVPALPCQGQNATPRSHMRAHSASPGWGMGTPFLTALAWGPLARV